MLFTETEYRVLEQLIGFIKENASSPHQITYQELALRVNNTSVVPIRLGRILGNIGKVISKTSNLTHAPIPNRIVVNKQTQTAGDGYIGLMQTVNKQDPTIQEIFEYNEWDLVLELAKTHIGKVI